MFSWCENLKKIQFPENLKTIGDYAFCGAGSATMSGLMPMIIPEKTTRIASYAFSSSRIIEMLVLPSSIEFLGNKAFDTNNNLTKVEMRRSTPPSSDTGNLFSPGTLANGTLIIPQGVDPLVFTQTAGWEFRSVINSDFNSIGHTSKKPTKSEYSPTQYVQPMVKSFISTIQQVVLWVKTIIFTICRRDYISLKMEMRYIKSS